MTALEIARRVQAREVSAEEVVGVALDRARATADLNAFVSLNDRALEAAREIDARVARGEPVGPLAGLGVGVVVLGLGLLSGGGAARAPEGGPA